MKSRKLSEMQMVHARGLLNGQLSAECPFLTYLQGSAGGESEQDCLCLCGMQRKQCGSDKLEGLHMYPLYSYILAGVNAQ